jgi:eukaryotic-like serine/threonine-protein kinase
VSSEPTQLGKYEIIGEVGRGGMGSVYKARDPVLDRIVALKTMAVDVLAEAGMRERFLREARSAARLQHPNIVTVYEFGEVEGAPFIAMEFLEGESLADAFAFGRLNEISDIVDIAAQLCDGLDYAHRHGVIHRDVKPSNVILPPEGGLKLVDFGIAWLDDKAFATRTGMLLGTPAYMAPEQFTGEPIDHRVDQWAVGVIVYELVAGRPPFDATTVPALIYQIVHTPPPPIDQRARSLPTALVSIVERALARQPRDRYPDLGAMGDALRGLRSQLPTLMHPAPPGGTRRLPPVTTQTLVETQAAPPSGAAPSPPAHDAPRVSRRTAFIEDGGFGEARRVQTLALAPDDSLLVAGATDGALHVWDLAARTKLDTLRNRDHLRTGHGSLTTCLAFSPDRTLLASGHLDGSVYLWDLATGVELEARLAHDGAIGGLAFPPDGETLVVAAADATIRFWELPAARLGEARRTLRRQPEAATCLALAKGGRAVVTGHTNKSLRVHDTASFRLVATIHGHRAPITALAASPTGAVAASGGRDGVVRMHDLDSREQLASHIEHTRPVASMAFFPQGRRVASVATDTAVVVWDLADPDRPTTLPGVAGENLVGVCVSADGRRLVCVTADGKFRVWLAH